MRVNADFERREIREHTKHKSVIETRSGFSAAGMGTKEIVESWIGASDTANDIGANFQLYFCDSLGFIFIATKYCSSQGTTSDVTAPTVRMYGQSVHQPFFKTLHRGAPLTGSNRCYEYHGWRVYYH